MVFSGTGPISIPISNLMTGYTVHTGSSQKFSQGWDQIFSGKPRQGKSAQSAPTPAAAKSGKKTPKSK